MENKCPKCNINLNNINYNNIKIRDCNLLSLKILFGEVNCNNRLKEFCDLCNASLKERVEDRFNRDTNSRSLNK